MLYYYDEFSWFIRLEPDDASCISQAHLFEGKLDNLTSDEQLIDTEKPHKVLFLKAMSVFMITLLHFILLPYTEHWFVIENDKLCFICYYSFTSV